METTTSTNSEGIKVDIKVAILFFCSAFGISSAVDLLADDDHFAKTELSEGFGKFEFALIGDTPYKVNPGQEYPPFDALVKDVNENEKITWVLHAGDIKSGGTACSDEMFYDRLERYNKFDKAVVMTPGDNEWTDCHRVKAGEYQPLERLTKLREVFFPIPGQTSICTELMEVESQAKYEGFEEFPENTLWVHQHVTFGAIHVVGSQNGLKAFDTSSSAVRTEADDEEVARRTTAALSWMDQIFAKAEQTKSAGVFLMIHANPGLERKGVDVNRTGFMEILGAMEEYIVSYDKPVVLAHGDSHYMRIDKPALQEQNFLANFTRVETFGSSNVHWIKVSVDPKSKEVFSFHQEIVK